MIKRVVPADPRQECQGYRHDASRPLPVFFVITSISSPSYDDENYICPTCHLRAVKEGMTGEWSYRKAWIDALTAALQRRAAQS